MSATSQVLWLALAVSLALTGCSSGGAPASDSVPAQVSATVRPVESTVATAAVNSPTAESARAARLDLQSASPTPTEPLPTPTQAVATVVMAATATAVPTATATATAVPKTALTAAQQALLASLPSQGAAPELNNEVWLNSDPLKLADLRGQVVLLDMWTFG